MEGKEFVLRNRDLISEWLEVQLDFVIQEVVYDSFSVMEAIEQIIQYINLCTTTNFNKLLTTHKSLDYICCLDYHRPDLWEQSKLY